MRKNRSPEPGVVRYFRPLTACHWIQSSLNKISLSKNGYPCTTLRGPPLTLSSLTLSTREPALPVSSIGCAFAAFAASGVLLPCRFQLPVVRHAEASMCSKMRNNLYIDLWFSDSTHARSGGVAFASIIVLSSYA